MEKRQVLINGIIVDVNVPESVVQDEKKSYFRGLISSSGLKTRS